MKQMTERARYWETVVREHGQSGMTVKAFCAERGLSEASFYWWRRELRQFAAGQQGNEAASEGFVQLVTSGQSEAHGASGVALQVDGRIGILVAPGFDQDTLRAVLAVVSESRPCSH